MSDFNASVSLGVNPPDPQSGVNTLNKILQMGSAGLGIRQQQQALQTGQATQQTAQAEAQGAQQAMQERQLLQKTLKSGVRPDTGQSLYNANNEMDADQLEDFATKNLPMIGQGVVQSILKTKADRVSLKSAVADLGDKYNNDISGRIRSFINDPQAKAADINASLSGYAQQNPDAAPAVLAAQNLVQHVDYAPDMKTKNDQLIHLAQMFQPAAKTAEQQAPSISTMQGPNGLQPVQTNPLAPGGIARAGAPLPQGVAPQVATSPQGNLGVIGSNGTMRPLTTPGPSGGPGAAPSKLQPLQRPGMNAPAADQARYNSQIAAASQHVQDVSAAANDLQNGVGPTRYRNDQIEDILNSTTFSPTGPDKAQLNWISSKIPGDSGDAFQKIGHYLAQNSAAIAQKMGVPGTNMGAEQAAAAAGNTSQNRGALLEVTKVNDAMNTALDMYNRGLAKATGNGSDPSKVAAYRQAFGQNFDMNVLRYDDALRRGDKAEIDNIKQQVGPQGLKSMGQKRAVLHSLADTGDLP